jgi:phage-related tail protein
MTRMDIFVVISGSFSMLITIPMIVLAVWSRREARELRSIQTDLVELMGGSRRLAKEIHLLQAEIRAEQHEAVAAAEVAVTAASDAVGQVGAAVEGVGRMVDALAEDGSDHGPDAAQASDRTS